MPFDGGASNFGYNHRILQVPANSWHRGCSRIFRCRGGSGGKPKPVGPGGSSVQVSFTSQIQSMVAVVEVLPVNAAATPLDEGTSNFSFNRRLLQVSANPWTRGCSRIFRCRNGSHGPGVHDK
ncbi:hypothetical protein V6N13_014264 [Hibiscus sabdariffa]